MTIQVLRTLVITDILVRLEVVSSEDLSLGWDASGVMLVGQLEAHSLL